jgi:hypothetical protein
MDQAIVARVALPSTARGCKPKPREMPPNSRYRRSLLLTAAAFVLVVLLGPTLGPATARAQKWEVVTREEGITITKRELPGRNFPIFRGVGDVEAPIWQAMGIIYDVPRYVDWQANCTQAKVLKAVSEVEQYVYTRTWAPWPVADRDAIYHAVVKVEFKPKFALEVRFESAKLDSVPPVKGVVRMANTRGFFRLTELGPNRTHVDYHVDGDPGGMLPTWLAKMAVKKVPLDAIKGMRKRAVVTRGKYNEHIKRWKALAAELQK